MSSKVHPVYCFLGPERGNKTETVAGLRADLIKIHGQDLEEHRFYAFETPLSDVLGLARNGSLFSSHKLILLNSAEEIKKKDDWESLKGYVRHPSETATLVVMTDETTLDKGFQGAVHKDAWKVFWEMFDNQKAGWLIHFFRERGFQLSSAGAEFFLEMVENTTDALAREAEKILPQLDPQREVEPDDLEEYLYHSKEETVFSLFDRMMKGHFEDVLEVWNKILLSQESQPVALLGGLVWQYRRLLSFLEMLEERQSPEEAFTKLGIRGKTAQKGYLSVRGKLNSDDVRRVLLLLEDFDLQLRGTRTENQALIMELFLYYAVVRKGHRPPAPRFFD